MYRETWANIDLNALNDNVEEIKKNTNKSLIGVVKANAYGHGDIEIAKHLQTIGTEILGVSSLDEAWHLINAGVTADILIFSYTDPKSILKANHPQFIYTIPSYEWFEMIRNFDTSLRLHLEVNVGMNRYGLSSIDSILEVLDTHHKLEGIYIHLQSPENLEIGQDQINRFEIILSQLNHTFKIISIGNAPSQLIVDTDLFTHVRIGIGLYGYRVDMPSLKPVLSLYSKVLYKEAIKKGDTVGYDYDYLASEDQLIGTVPIGYADGFDMRNNASPLFINNNEVPIVGKICMDQTMIRITDDININDTVEIIGPHRTLSKVSKETGISKYVLITSLTTRIERRYYLNEHLIHTTNR